MVVILPQTWIGGGDGLSESLERGLIGLKWVTTATHRIHCNTSPCPPSGDFGAARMKIELLNAGRMAASAALWRQDDDPERVPAYVVETDTERILIDRSASRGLCRRVDVLRRT